MAKIDGDLEALLRKATFRSTHKRYMTGCIIVSPKLRRVISDGCAHKGTMSLRELYSMHAEMHALARGRHLELDGAVAYVLTIARKSGNITSAKPCLTCAVALRSAGIATVRYSIRNYSYQSGGCSSLEGEYIDLELDEFLDLESLKVYEKPCNHNPQ